MKTINNQSALENSSKEYGIIVTVLASILGYAIPIYLTKFRRENRWDSSISFFLLKSFASGIIMGVSFLHLLAESIEKLKSFSDFPGKQCYINYNISIN